MARKKKDVDEAGGDDVAKKKSKMIPAVVLAVGLLGGGYFMGPGKSASAEPAAPPTTTTTLPGPVVVLEPITLNVPGGHYLKVGMALQMAAPKEGEEPAAAEGEEVDPKVAHAPVLDAAIDVLGGTAYEQLVTPEGRETAKKTLVEGLHDRYQDQLVDVYFTEFVLQ